MSPACAICSSCRSNGSTASACWARRRTPSADNASATDRASDSLFTASWARGKRFWVRGSRCWVRFWVLGSGFGTLDAVKSRMVAHHYWELECWQLANDLKLRVYAFTAKMPVARDVKYCDQLRESTRSAPRNIAEGFGRYRPAEFARCPAIARASFTETRNHTRAGRDLNY